MVEIRDNDTDEHISALVSWWLEHDSERKVVAHRAQEIGKKFFSWDFNFAQRLFDSLQRYKREEFGWWFPTAFTVREPRLNVCDCNERQSEASYVLAPRCSHVSPQSA